MHVGACMTSSNVGVIVDILGVAKDFLALCHQKNSTNQRSL